MVQINDGQCGRCAHFGAQHAGSEPLVSMRIKGVAAETYIDDCTHPRHVETSLKVSVISGCDGFTPA